MFDEPSVLLSGDSGPQEAPEPRSSTQDSVTGQVEMLVAEVLHVYHVEHQPAPQVLARFTGQLRIDSAAAFAQLDAAFKALNLHAMLLTDDADQHVVLALKGRAQPRALPRWPNLLLLALTLLSLLFVGSQIEAAHNDTDASNLLRGWPYATSMILILGAHELGHYFVARYHRMNITPPYFLPFPSLFGTLGAFILFRDPLPNRKIMFDVSVAGPLAGLVVALPVLFIGLAGSDVEPLPTDEDYLREGDSILYVAAKYIVFGDILPTEDKDVFVNQVAWAGWGGLLLTALNLIPVGQLDGGHIIHTLLGRRVQHLYWPLMMGLLVLSLLNEAWLFFTLLLLLFGRFRATPLDSITPLDTRRRRLAYVVVVIFVLIFVPLPLQSITP
ncbi:MAG: site-2 protease family protein [Anaerolineae bacterium]|nr:site-2 protease family protein [Anaerolineae bacterium]